MNKLVKFFAIAALTLAFACGSKEETKVEETVATPEATTEQPAAEAPAAVADTTAAAPVK